MAVDIKAHGTVGCAYYVAREERLCCMDDVKIGGLEVVDRREWIENDVLLQNVADRTSKTRDSTDDTPKFASHRADELFTTGKQDWISSGWRLESTTALEVLRANQRSDEAPHTPYQVEIRPPQEFSYEGAKSKLVGVDTLFQQEDYDIQFLVPGAPSAPEEVNSADLDSTDRQGKLLRLSSWIDFTSEVSVGCLGAVIACIQRKRSSEHLPNDDTAQYSYRVTSIEMFSPRGTMFINTDALSSLQIFSPESHPNAFNQGPGTQGSKENLSVYGLFQHLARTPQGKVRLRQCFLRPSIDQDEINDRLDFVGVLVRPDNTIPLQKLSKSMSKIKNVRTTMIHLHKGVNGGSKGASAFKSGVWATLLAFAYHTIDILDTLGEVLGDLPMRSKAFDTMNRFDLHAVGKMIHDVVDLESSIEQHRTVVKYGVSDELDNVRRVYDGMDDLLSRTASAIVRTLPPDLKINLNVIYFPQLGFHITVPIDPDTGQAVYNGDEDSWEKMFTTQNQVYLKDSRMQEMDETIGDIWGTICGE